MQSRPTARLCTMAGIQFAMIAAVAWSPWSPPGTRTSTGGLPSIVITSRRSLAPPAPHGKGAHLLAGGGQHQRQEIHDDPRVHARAQQADARLAGAPVE